MWKMHIINRDYWLSAIPWCRRNHFMRRKWLAMSMKYPQWYINRWDGKCWRRQPVLFGSDQATLTISNHIFIITIHCFSQMFLQNLLLVSGYLWCDVRHTCLDFTSSSKTPSRSHYRGDPSPPMQPSRQKILLPSSGPVEKSLLILQSNLFQSRQMFH